jgi:predicted metal-dependent hydrolase
MNQSKTLEFEGIGEVLFEPSGRAKRLNVSIRPFNRIRVAVPRRTSFKTAKEFVNSKLTWIQKNLDKMKQMENDHEILAAKAAGIDEDGAKSKIAGRVNELAQLHDFAYNRVYVRNLKSRWGSCSHKNNISLNMKLAVLPEEILDYVILHELVHTRISNHSNEFWNELIRIDGKARELDLKLKRYNMMLL